ncbi:hypothetical protein OAE97_01360 [Verrucomicrobia bacterium]|nr:hypothetical protein [Verrucomicrobiota bacterium]
MADLNNLWVLNAFEIDHDLMHSWSTLNGISEEKLVLYAGELNSLARGCSMQMIKQNLKVRNAPCSRVKAKNSIKGFKSQWQF